MNKYYKRVRDTFDELIEVSFVGGSKFVQLVYYEAKPRSLKEQQDYEFNIEKEKVKKNTSMELNNMNRNGDDSTYRRTRKEGDNNFDSYRKRQAPRRAKKYVFFEVL